MTTLSTPGVQVHPRMGGGSPPNPPLYAGGPGMPYNGGETPPKPPKTLFHREWPFSIPQSPRFARGLIIYENHLPTGTPAEVEMPAPHITITFLAEEDSRRRHRESKLVPPPVAVRDCDEPIVHGVKRAPLMLISPFCVHLILSKLTCHLF